MSKTNNQKLKLLYLAKLFQSETDEQHKLTAKELLRKLNQTFNIELERKTLYSDIDELKLYGMDIINEKDGRSTNYYLASRDFELAELKLLVDSVQSSRFITEQKSAQLIKKLEGLVSRYDATQLHRQVILTGRVKTLNETIYYSVDKIHNAINTNKQIRFQYFQWNEKKAAVLRHNGAWYEISPWALVYDDENYYLLAYDSSKDTIKHYRVDKMLNLEVSDKSRKGKSKYESIDLPSYSKGLFGMYGGEITDVSLLCENDKAGILIDRFGTDIPVIPVDSGHFRTHIQISSSDQFLGWIFALGDGIKILSPQTLIDKIKSKAAETAKLYE